MTVGIRQCEHQCAEDADRKNAGETASDHECTFPLAVGVLNGEICPHDSADQTENSSCYHADKCPCFSSVHCGIFSLQNVIISKRQGRDQSALANQG